MVAIVNKGPSRNVGYIPDECIYEIKVNHSTIAHCTHRTINGLSTLLRIAADAVDEAAALGQLVEH